jgi:predicted nucleic acid-binding protein
VSERIVSDSTCLIALERIGNVEILPAIFETVLIPPAVEREVGISLPWLKVERLSDPSSVVALKLIIDDGEAEAIALAQEQQCRIITDDRRARSVARKFGLDVIGTVGILVLARKRNIVSSIEPLLIDLDVAGFYVSTALREEALRLVDE